MSSNLWSYICVHTGKVVIISQESIDTHVAAIRKAFGPAVPEEMDNITIFSRTVFDLQKVPDLSE